MPVPPVPDDPPPTLRAAMRELAGGVSLITVGAGDARRGFTATSVTSLTLEPPCVLVCANRRVSALPAILAQRRFGISVLGDQHRNLAIRFSGATGISGADRFAVGDWRNAALGLPLLAGALAAVACDLEEIVERHSHLILIGAVRDVRIGAGGSPLLYAQGLYGRFDPEA